MPAAAVIPALWVSIWLGLGIFLESVAALDCVARPSKEFYFEETRVLQAGACPEHASREQYDRTSVLFCWFLELRE